MANFEDEDGKDDAGALKEACARLERHDWDQDDLLFWFGQAEIKMTAVGVKKQFTKLQAVSCGLPKHVLEAVKPILRKQENEFENRDTYKQLKKEVLRIFGPKKEAAIEKALSRTLTDLPSTLARQLMNDICKHDLVNTE